MKINFRMVNVNAFYLMLDLLVLFCSVLSFAVDMENAQKTGVYATKDGKELTVPNKAAKIIAMDTENV